MKERKGEGRGERSRGAQNINLEAGNTKRKNKTSFIHTHCTALHCTARTLDDTLEETERGKNESVKEYRQLLRLQ